MPGEVKVVFGSYDDVAKTNVFAQTPDGTIVKVAASVIDSINKKPLDLRDKAAVNIDPATVTKLIIAANQPATTQPIAAAVSKVVTLMLRPEAPIGPPKPKATTTTSPTTIPAVPEVPKSKWVLAGATAATPVVDADDSKITALLAQFHPMRVEKYLEKPSSAKVVKGYTISVFTTGVATPSVLTLVDPGNEANLIGTYNGLTFEVTRSIATDLGAEFGKTAAPMAMPGQMPGQMPKF